MDHHDEARDLYFGMLALQRGLIDQSQLLAAFERWSRARNQPMADIMAGMGMIDGPGRSELEQLVASHHLQDGEAAIVDPALPATIAHPHASDRGRHASSPDSIEHHTLGSQFAVVRPHARGGLGEVFIAHDPELDRHVALKQLQSHSAYDPVSQSRFLREARVTGRLEHPGIVPVYGLGRHPDGRPYYTMRFIEGETLMQAIDRYHAAQSGPREPRAREIAFHRLLRSMIDACNAVAYAHSRGVVHRDIKPHNIMLGRFGETLVVDWGIAKTLTDLAKEPSDESAAIATAEEPSLTSPGAALGTPQYMSPEQAAGETERVGPASDVYGLGATLYCILVGHGPFPSGSVADVLDRAGRGIFPSPRRLRRSVDAALEVICLKAMALDPALRHATPLALAESIEAWLADLRYRGEHEQTLHDAGRSMARLSIERAHHSFDRELHHEGMLWLARALESVPPDSPALDRAVRTSLGGWRAEGKLLERSLAHKGAVHRAVFAPDGRRLATACADGMARLWDVAKGTPLSTPMAHDGPVRALAFGPDGQFIATAGDDGTMRRWNAVTGAPIGSPCQHGAPVTEVSFSSDGTRIATACRTSEPCLWDAASGRPIGSARPHDTRVISVKFNAGGNLAAAACEDGTVWLWESSTGTLTGEPLRHQAAVSDLVFSPDGRTLVTACLDRKARIWDLRARAPVSELAHRGDVGLVAFSPDGRLLATACSDGTARLWDSATSRPIGEPLSHRAPVQCLQFNDDGTIFASGSQDGTVRLWDAGSGLPVGPTLEHRGPVNGLSFSPAGRRLATASSDASARYWRVPSPIAGDVERVVSWVRVTTELEFDEGDAIRPISQLDLWELRRHLQQVGGPPVK
jgi:WD40 repeat protein/tRNA A-37 threonylcarbamoyl transferase component Bud32